MKITLEGELLTKFLRYLIKEDISTLAELNASIAELNEEAKKVKKHYSIWVNDGDGIYHCLVCDAAVLRDDPSGLASVCPCCGARMIKPGCDDKRRGK